MRYLSNLSALRAASLLKVFTKPEMVPARLFAPTPLDPVQGALHFKPDLSREQAESYRKEIRASSSWNELNEASLSGRHRPFGYKPCLDFVYIMVRHLRPAVIVETGVFDGHSSAVILMALQKNDCGELVSIDLPASSPIVGSTHAMEDTALPPGRDPGWIIPQSLRARHRLLLGDAVVLLPTVLAEFAAIDIFIHDSLHTYSHMLWEYRTAWPKLRAGGFLMSDDVFWSAAFHRFAREQRRPYSLVDYDFGAMRK